MNANQGLLARHLSAIFCAVVVTGCATNGATNGGAVAEAKKTAFLDVQKVDSYQSATVRVPSEYVHVLALSESTKDAVPEYWTDADHDRLAKAIKMAEAERKRIEEQRQRDQDAARRRAAAADAAASGGGADRGLLGGGANTPERRVLTDIVVYFAFGKDELSDPARLALRKAVEELGAKNIGTINVVGHTDAVGSDAANDELGRRRSDAVRSFLATMGVDGARISARTKGEADPIADNDSDAGRAKNRRASIAVNAVQPTATAPGGPIGLEALDRNVPLVVGRDGSMKAAPGGLGAAPANSSASAVEGGRVPVAKPDGTPSGVSIVPSVVSPSAPRRPQVFIVSPDPATEEDYKLFQKHMGRDLKKE